jgi:hypothetical protein
MVISGTENHIGIRENASPEVLLRLL